MGLESFDLKTEDEDLLLALDQVEQTIEVLQATVHRLKQQITRQVARRAMQNATAKARQPHGAAEELVH